MQNPGRSAASSPHGCIPHPAHQRQGHATRAFQALEDVARPLGLSGIVLHVLGRKPGVQAHYAKPGY